MESIKDNIHLLRDSSNQAIINTDIDSFEDRKKQKDLIKQKDIRISNLERRVEILGNQIDIILKRINK